MPCSVTQDKCVMIENSDKIWSSGEGNGKPLQCSCLENPMNSMKRQKDRKLKDELQSVAPQFATGNKWRNNSRKNEETKPEQKQHPVVDVTGVGSKVRCCKEQYCIGTWNVRSMNQGKLEVVKQEVARVNIDILGISKLKCTGMGEFNSNHHYLFPAVIPAGSCFTIIYFILFLSLGNQKYYYNNKRCLLSFIL